MEPRHLREFDYLGDAAYLDTASVGMLPQRTLDHCRDFQDAFAASYGRLCFGPYGAQRAEAAQKLARLIGADPDEIMFTRNTTEGSSLLAAGYPLEPGASVVSAAGEYPSVVLGWAQRQAAGVKLRLVPVKNGVLDPADVLAAMDETTKVVALSFVRYESGFRTDLARIGAACRARGVLFAVDAIQGLGRHPVNVRELGIDVLSCGGFKGLMAPFGVGFAYVRRDLLPCLTPWAWSDDNVDVDEAALGRMASIPALPLRAGAARLMAGSQNTFGITALGKSVELLLEIGVENVQAHVLQLEAAFRDAVQGLPAALRGGNGPAHWSGNVCMDFDPARTQAVAEALARHQVYARLDTGFLRVSFHCFNTPAHLRRAAQALKEAL